MLTVELFPERKREETEDEIELYDVSDITDPIVEDAIEFMQDQMKTGERASQVIERTVSNTRNRG